MKRFRVAVLAGSTLLVTAAMSLALAGQSPTPPQPQGPGAERARKLPVKLHPHDIEQTFIRMPLPAGHEQYGRIQGDRMKQFLRRNHRHLASRAVTPAT